MKASNDPIGDFLTRIRNANVARLENCRAPFSQIKQSIAEILKDNGYIWSYEIVEPNENNDNNSNKKNKKIREIVVRMKYVDKEPAITNLKRISKPGYRQYVGAKNCPKVIGGMGIIILSTSKGVMTDASAREQKTGGELLAKVW